MTQTQSTAEEFVDAKWLMANYSISEPTIWRWVKTKVLPPPIKLGPNTSRWRRQALQDWEQARAQGSGAGA